MLYYNHLTLKQQNIKAFKQRENMRKVKTINVNELQSGASKVIKDVQDGEIYEVMRYSKPAAVIIPYGKYEKLKGECRHCVDEIKEIIKEKK